MYHESCVCVCSTFFLHKSCDGPKECFLMVRVGQTQLLWIPALPLLPARVSPPKMIFWMTGSSSPLTRPSLRLLAWAGRTKSQRTEANWNLNWCLLGTVSNMVCICVNLQTNVSYQCDSMFHHSPFVISTLQAGTSSRNPTSVSAYLW